MKEYVIVETYDAKLHMRKVGAALNDGWDIVTSGQIKNINYSIYYTHMVKETEELEKKCQLMITAV